MRALSARAVCPFAAAKASFARSFRADGTTEPFAVILLGWLSVSKEGRLFHSKFRRPTGTVSLSLGMGGFLKVTWRFDSVGTGDLERVC